MQTIIFSFGLIFEAKGENSPNMDVYGVFGIFGKITFRNCVGLRVSPDRYAVCKENNGLVNERKPKSNDFE